LEIGLKGTGSNRRAARYGSNKGERNGEKEGRGCRKQIRDRIKKGETTGEEGNKHLQRGNWEVKRNLAPSKQGQALGRVEAIGHGRGEARKSSRKLEPFSWNGGRKEAGRRVATSGRWQ